MSNILLEVIVPPEKPRITDENNKEVRLKLGPYRLGDTVTITCEVNKRLESVSIYFDLQLFLPSYCHSSRKLTIFKKLESNLRFFVEYFHQSLCHSAQGIVTQALKSCWARACTGGSAGKIKCCLRRGSSCP